MKLIDLALYLSSITLYYRVTDQDKSIRTEGADSVNRYIPNTQVLFRT